MKRKARVPPAIAAFDESNHPQNHMVTLVDVKPGSVRLWTLKSVLWFFEFAGGALQRSGSILGISTIHFVRWVLLDNERRLLFLANYDGRWAAYLGDFINCASFVITAIWSNTKDFPPTGGYSGKAPDDAQQFAQWTRDHNLKSLVWYSAYPDSTVRNLLKAISIRDGLASGPSNRQPCKPVAPSLKEVARHGIGTRQNSRCSHHWLRIPCGYSILVFQHRLRCRRENSGSASWCQELLPNLAAERQRRTNCSYQCRLHLRWAASARNAGRLAR